MSADETRVGSGPPPSPFSLDLSKVNRGSPDDKIGKGKTRARSPGQVLSGGHSYSFGRAEENQKTEQVATSKIGAKQEASSTAASSSMNSAVHLPPDRDGAVAKLLRTKSFLAGARAQQGKAASRHQPAMDKLHQRLEGNQNLLVSVSKGIAQLEAELASIQKNLDKELKSIGSKFQSHKKKEAAKEAAKKTAEGASHEVYLQLASLKARQQEYKKGTQDLLLELHAETESVQKEEAETATQVKEIHREKHIYKGAAKEALQDLAKTCVKQGKIPLLADGASDVERKQYELLLGVMLELVESGEQGTKAGALATDIRAERFMLNGKAPERPSEALKKAVEERVFERRQLPYPPRNEKHHAAYTEIMNSVAAAAWKESGKNPVSGGSGLAFSIDHQGNKLLFFKPGQGESGMPLNPRAVDRNTPNRDVAANRLGYANGTSYLREALAHYLMPDQTNPTILVNLPVTPVDGGDPVDCEGSLQLHVDFHADLETLKGSVAMESTGSASIRGAIEALESEIAVDVAGIKEAKQNLERNSLNVNQYSKQLETDGLDDKTREKLELGLKFAKMGIPKEEGDIVKYTAHMKELEEKKKRLEDIQDELGGVRASDPIEISGQEKAKRQLYKLIASEIEQGHTEPHQWTSVLRHTNPSTLLSEPLRFAALGNTDMGIQNKFLVLLENPYQDTILVDGKETEVTIYFDEIELDQGGAKPDGWVKASNPRLYKTELGQAKLGSDPRFKDLRREARDLDPIEHHKIIMDHPKFRRINQQEVLPDTGQTAGGKMLEHDRMRMYGLQIAIEKDWIVDDYYWPFCETSNSSAINGVYPESKAHEIYLLAEQRYKEYSEHNRVSNPEQKLKEFIADEWQKARDART